MFADISLFASLNSGVCTRFVKNSELLPYLKEYAEKSTGALLCQQWLDSIRDRSDVAADLTARLSDAAHDYDKEKATAATKLKDQMMDGDQMKLDAEDRQYISTLDQSIQQQVISMLENTFNTWKASMEAQLAQGAQLEDLLGGQGQVTPQESPLTQPQAAPLPQGQAQAAPIELSDMEY